MTIHRKRFTELMHQVAQGDQQAMSRLIHLFGNKLLRFTRFHLRRCPILCSLFDAEDLAHDIWVSLLCNPAKCEPFTLPAPFGRYLAGMARNQMRKLREQYLDTDKRDLRRKRHLSDPKTAEAAASLPNKQLTPSQCAQSNEDWEQWFFSFSDKEQQIILLWRAGCNQREIAEELECCERTIERRLAHVRCVPPPSCSVLN